jgi:hypothetical protein
MEEIADYILSTVGAKHAMIQVKTAGAVILVGSYSSV